MTSLKVLLGGWILLGMGAFNLGAAPSPTGSAAGESSSNAVPAMPG